MKVLVTGCFGRVGSKVCAELLNKGYDVIGLDTAQPRGRCDFEYVQASLEDADAVGRAVEKADAVIHLGAFMSWFDQDAPKVFSTNVTSTFHLLQAVARQNVQKLLFASTGDVYPESGAAYLPVDEHHPRRPTSVYGMTKLLGEEMVWFHSRKYGIPSVVLRFSHTQDASELLDPDSFFSGARFFLRGKIRQQRMFGNVKALAILEPHDDGTEKLLLSRGEDGTPYRMPICDTRDLVQGIILALEAEKAIGETIAIGPEEAVSFDEAIRIMHEVTGLPIVDVRLPGPAVHYHTSIAKAKELLHFRPRWSFADMLKEAAVAWRERASKYER
jgi:UDP-glucose 4-epimerase